MNVWANTVITHKGSALLAKLTITGAGYVTPGLLQNQTAVADPKQSLVFRSVSYPEDGKCAMPVTLTNEGLAAGYEATQVGVFANDPDEGKILFFIAQSQTATKGTTIPSEAEMPGYSAEWTFNFKYGQADGVNVTVDPANTVSREEMGAYVEDAVRSAIKVTTCPDMPVYSYTAITYGNGVFVAAAGNNSAAFRKGDSVWQMGTLPGLYDSTRVAYGNGKFVAVDSFGLTTHSTDGINWVEGNNQGIYALTIAYGDGKFVIIGDGTKTIYSKDGINWIIGGDLPRAPWVSVAYGNGKFVAAATRGRAAFSEDGIRWTETIPESLEEPYREGFVTYGNGMFVLGRKYGKTTAYSTDGVNWIEGGETNYFEFNSITYGNGVFVGVGSSRRIIHSKDGINWETTDLDIYGELTSVSYGDGMFVAVARFTDDRSALYSTDGINWKTEGAFVEQGGADCAEKLMEAIGAASKEELKAAVTVTSDVRLHLSVTADGILQVTVLDDEGG